MPKASPSSSPARGRALPATGPEARPGEAGVALLLALLALVGLTLLATSGMVVVNSDLQASRNHRSSTEAFYVTDQGLSEYLANVTDPDAGAVFDLPDGRVTISTQQLVRIDHGPRRIYRATAVGTYVGAGGDTLRRRQSVLLLRNPLPGRAVAAVSAANGLQVTGDASTISGVDAAASPCGTDGDLAGIAAPPGELDTGGGTPQGSPPVDQSRSASEMLSAMKLDWPAIVSETAVTPDYRVTGAGQWPNYDSIPTDSYPIVKIDASDFTLGSQQSGRGTIVATGNLVTSGSFRWDGVVLVGGSLTSDGYMQVTGAVVTGLNKMIDPGNIAASDIGDGGGSGYVRYDSCRLEAALDRFATVSVEPGSWAEEY